MTLWQAIRDVTNALGSLSCGFSIFWNKACHGVMVCQQPSEHQGTPQWERQFSLFTPGHALLSQIVLVLVQRYCTIVANILFNCLN